VAKNKAFVLLMPKVIIENAGETLLNVLIILTPAGCNAILRQHARILTLHARTGTYQPHGKNSDNKVS
jgi:hypothetical protein